MSGWHLFEVVGLELEYMIVDAETLAVRPLADELLRLVGGGTEMSVERGDVAWSNELALHVIEIKTNGPVAALDGVAAKLQADVAAIHELLAPLDARLLPGGMHPWMDPHAELVLWPHEDDVIYATFDRIFSCRGHGWANLQSTHINLPFVGDDEFRALHAAIRAVLPLLPALAASSPVMDGRVTGLMDNRLDVYRSNAARVPSVSGRVVPEPVWTRAAYEGELLAGIYRDIAPLDPEGILQHEWLNARGAIARFDRGAIEIRTLDIQECPAADVAVAALVVRVVKALAGGELAALEEVAALDTDRLAAQWMSVVREADHAWIDEPGLLAVLGHERPVRARDAWVGLKERLLPDAGEHEPALGVILEHGCLARRLSDRLGPAPSRSALREVYGELADCLREARMFPGA